MPIHKLVHNNTWVNIDTHSWMGSPYYYKRSLLVYPVLKVVGMVLYIVCSNHWERQTEHSSLRVQAKNSPISSCSLLGKALYTGVRSVSIRCSIPKISEGTDRHIDRLTDANTHGVRVRNSSSSLCMLPGQALYACKRSLATQYSVPEISERTDKQTDRHTEYGY